ncbi:hypothetical protein BSL78_05491 [Apostichopus japonicus]|uniref:C2 domain-containing protein n=1 Tax=Stichopus japonicus TaxID=307972 RepID=A0A2G8LBE4_STIJA|nr:hypothetical protein BSL78_05491 [Apostichopus japonicus]
MNTTASKAQEYQLDLRSVNCYSSGKYQLKLEVKASDSQYDLSKVKVESTSESVDFEITEQTLQSQVLLSDGKLKYYFPKELLREDVEVFISLQVTRYSQEQPSDEGASPSFLNGKLVIHPRQQNKKPASLNEEPTTSSSSPHKQPTSTNEIPTLVNEEPTSSRDNPIPSKDESKLKDGVSGQLTNEPSHSRDEPSPSNIKPSSLKEGNDHLLPDEANSPSQELANLSTESTPSSVQDPAITSGTINLYVKLEDENIQQLGGKIWYEEKFNIMEEDEGKEDEEIETEAASAAFNEEGQKDDEVKDRDKESKSISQSPKPTPVFPDKQPPTEKSMSEYVPSPESSRVGKLIAIIHAAHLLPSPQTLQCRPFVKGFVRCFNGNVLTSESKHEETLPSQNASLSPLWEHQMCVLIDQADVSKATLTLQLADFATSSTLSEFQIPISYLEPFHQYHLDLIRSNDYKEDIHLFVSVLYQPSELPVLGELMYKALEVNILSLDMPVANPVGPLTATACLCSDYHANRNVLKNQDVHPTPVHFPSPHSSSFLVPTDVRSAFGHTQISIPARSETHPQWYHQFLFVNHRDLSSIFTDTSALIIYLSAAASAFDGRSWKLSQQIGVALQPLNKIVFDAMTDSRGKGGIKVHALKFQSTSLYGPNSKPLGINLTLRLIRGKNIESAISSSSPEFLPSLESFCHQEPAAEESKKQIKTEDRLKQTVTNNIKNTPPRTAETTPPSPANDIEDSGYVCMYLDTRKKPHCLSKSQADRSQSLRFIFNVHDYELSIVNNSATGRHTLILE